MIQWQRGVACCYRLTVKAWDLLVRLHLQRFHEACLYITVSPDSKSPWNDTSILSAHSNHQPFHKAMKKPFSTSVYFHLSSRICLSCPNCLLFLSSSFLPLLPLNLLLSASLILFYWFILINSFSLSPSFSSCSDTLVNPFFIPYSSPRWQILNLSTW